MHFRVEIRGENFLLDLDGEHAKFGFKATRVVRAESFAEAQRIAMIQIHHELNQSPHTIKSTPDAPRVSIENLEEIRFYQRLIQKRSRGFDFISEEQLLP